MTKLAFPHIKSDMT